MVSEEELWQRFDLLVEIRQLRPDALEGQQSLHQICLRRKYFKNEVEGICWIKPLGFLLESTSFDHLQVKIVVNVADEHVYLGDDEPKGLTSSLA